VNPSVLSLAVEVFLNQADTEMLATLSLPLSLPRHPDNIPQPVLHERIKVGTERGIRALARCQHFSYEMSFLINIFKFLNLHDPPYPKVKAF
jgi:hypothetical protein